MRWRGELRAQVPEPPPDVGGCHGLGYTDWAYEAIELTGDTVRVRVRNTGARPGREVVQIYVAPVDDGAVERPARWLAGFASVEAGPGQAVEAEVVLPERAFQIWDESANAWTTVPGSYAIEAGRSVADRRVSVPLTV